MFWTALQAMGAVGAFLVIAWQMRRDSVQRSIELLLQFDDKFESAPLRRARSAVARAFLDGEDPPRIEAEDILGFFETIGLVTNRRAMKLREVDSLFFVEVVFYSTVLETKIKDDQKEDPAYWSEFLRLGKRIRQNDPRAWERLAGDKTDMRDVGKAETH